MIGLAENYTTLSMYYDIIIHRYSDTKNACEILASRCSGCYVTITFGDKSLTVSTADTHKKVYEKLENKTQPETTQSFG